LSHQRVQRFICLVYQIDKGSWHANSGTTKDSICSAH
jgi:hypothetical protein